MPESDPILKGPEGAEIIRIDDACDALLSSYGEMSASEAMTRAFVAERHEKRDTALFWIAVYQHLIKESDGNLTIFEQMGE